MDINTAHIIKGVYFNINSITSTCIRICIFTFNFVNSRHVHSHSLNHRWARVSATEGGGFTNCSGKFFTHYLPTYDCNLNIAFITNQRKAIKAKEIKIMITDLIIAGKSRWSPL